MPEKPAASSSRRPATGTAADEPAVQPAGAAPEPPAAGPPAAVATRKGRYLIGFRSAPGFAPMSADGLQSQLTSIEGVEVVKRLKSRSFSPMSTGFGGGGVAMPEIIVAQMDTTKGEMLMAQAKVDPRYVVEPNLRLLRTDTGAFGSNQGAFFQVAGLARTIRLRVVGEAGQPLARALLRIHGDGLPCDGVTDEAGRATITFFGDSVQSIWVKPAANYWDRMVVRPDLNGGGETVIALRPLSETFPGFPGRGVLGWGQVAMGLDRLNPSLTGRGVKIGIIDTGCDVSHPQLVRIRNGLNLSDAGDANAWTSDPESHGTHVAGIIGAARAGEEGIRGFAPDAEIHVFKVFPGCTADDLIEALDHCIELGIDVVNMSLGIAAPLEFVDLKIAEARSKGVACVVAAGNESKPVMFPGTLPTVLTVSAVGKLGEQPADTSHALTVMPGGLGELFPAKFSCFGPQVGVSGPGVAVLSCVPGGYAAWDGTSMAAPHVTGLAALVLAHHPAFQGKPKTRNAARVDQLFQILRGASVPVVAEPTRGGAGLPDAIIAAGQVGGAPAGLPIMGAAAGIGPPLGNPPAGFAGPPGWPHGMPPVGGSLFRDGSQAALLAALLGDPRLLQTALQLRAAGFG